MKKKKSCEYLIDDLEEILKVLSPLSDYSKPDLPSSILKVVHLHLYKEVRNILDRLNDSEL